jgi:TetR/AcrR family transcriptional repressor of nem operon
MDSNTAVRIRETAHDLIAERGDFGFSYADIAQTVGIRKASIHHHFPSKRMYSTVSIWGRDRQHQED